LNVRSEIGIALVFVMMVALVISAVGIGLILTSSSELQIAANYRNADGALAAADAALERALSDFPGLMDWTPLLTGASRSGFVDGAPTGTRRLPDGSTIDLAQVVNRANCGKPAACSTSDRTAATVERPWGANNPSWQLYAYGSLDQLASTRTSPFYVAVLVGDDGAENDGDPGRDGVDAQVNPGSGVIEVRAVAFGPRGLQKAVEATVSNRGGVRLLSWRALP
jgi:hypothetical protein